MAASNGKYSCILLFGGPGSGKGTQGVVLGQMPNLVHFAMGDIFRGLDKKSDIGTEFLSYSTEGHLVPDELTVRVFRNHIESEIAAGRVDLGYHTLILDGIPRTVDQVRLLAAALDVRAIVHLVVEDRSALIKRLAGRALKSNRPDDADPAVIENRLDVYDKETAPVLAEYPSDLVHRVNGDQAPLAVLRDVAASLVGVVSPLL